MRRRLLTELIGAPLLCLVAISPATTAAAELDDIGAKAGSAGLSREPGWRALVEYRESVIGTGIASQADRSSFFFSENGKVDPEAELLATVRALFMEKDRDRERCRFPARYEWLAKRLSIDDGFNVIERCSALKAWYQPLAAESVSIVFASSYLDSPASLFGHTFLRFQTPGTPVLLTPTVNIAVDSTQVTTQFAFVAKGLAGGYPSQVDSVPFYRRLKSYGDGEGRALWDFPLDLSRAEIHLLLLHLWEIRNGVFDYYFLDENCSYRILGLIEAARPSLQLTHQFKGDVVPIESIRALKSAGIVAGEPAYWAPNGQTLTWRSRAFSRPMVEAVIAWSEGSRPPEDAGVLTPAQHAEALFAATAYFSVLVNQGRIDVDRSDSILQALIRARLALTFTPPADPAPPSDSPLEAHSGHAATVTAADRDGRAGVEIGYDAFRHLLTDPLPGFDAGSEVTILGGAIDLDRRGLALEELDVFSVRSYAPGTAFFPRPAWSVHLGAQRENVGRARPLVGSFGAARGDAVDLGPGELVLTLGADLNGSPEFRAGAAFEGSARVALVRQREVFSFEFYAELARALLGDDRGRRTTAFEVGARLSRDWSVRAGYEHVTSGREDDRANLELRRSF